MSNSNFDSAVNFLQNALNAAIFSSGEKPQADAGGPPEPQRQPSPLLPGFEPPPAVPSEPPPVAAGPAEPPAAADPFAPPPEACAPPLPGMVTESQDPPPVIHHRLGKSSMELHPPAQKRSALLARAERDGNVRKPFRLNAVAVLGFLSGLLGLGLAVACVGLFGTSDAPTEKAPPEIPFALLPDTADPSLWDTVAGMSGEIDGIPLRFERGIATGNGITFKLQFDFCRSGSDIYAKVAGDKTYVVRLDGQGRITRSYPAPRNNRPLKALFGK